MMGHSKAQEPSVREYKDRYAVLYDSVQEMASQMVIDGSKCSGIGEVDPQVRREAIVVSL